MKKLLMILLCLPLSMVGSAHDMVVDGIYYNVSDDKAEVTFNSDDLSVVYSGSITIPQSVTNGNNTYNVNAIGENAFKGSTNLTSVTIPTSVTTIGSSAFSGCEGLTSITLPSNVTTIGSSAFYDCTGLKSINIPVGVTSIETLTFHNCSSLTTMTLPSSVTSIGLKAFTDCTSLTSITIWAPSLTNYGALAFHKQDGDTLVPLDNLQHIYVPSDGVSTYQESWKGEESTIEYDYSSKISAITLTNHAASDAYWSTFYYSGSDALVDANTKVYTVTVSGTTAMLNEVADRKIKAGQAVIIKSSAATTELSSATGVDDTYFGSNDLKGVDVTTTVSTSDYASKTIYTMASGTTGLGFYRYSPATLGANRAFLAFDATVSAPEFFLFSEGITGINTLNAKRFMFYNPLDTDCFVSKERPTYYNIAGQGVAHPQKGIYIVNGRQIVVK